MFRSETKLGRAFFVAAGVKLRQAFHANNRPDQECLLKIKKQCGYQDDQYFMDGKYHHFDGRTEEVRAAQMLFLKYADFNKPILFDPSDFKDKIKSNISDIAENYAADAADKIIGEFAFWSNRGFNSSLDRDSEKMPTFALPISKRHYLQFQRYSFNHDAKSASVHMEILKVRSFWEGLLSLYK